MRMRKLGLVGIGWLVAACGGADAMDATSWSAEATSGTDQAIVVSPAGSQTGEVVEVIESRLPTSVPRVDMAAAELEGPPGAIAQAETPAVRETSVAEICPADIETLRARSRNIPLGVAMVLTARGEADVERLRDRMRELALAISTEHAQECADPAHAGVTVPASTPTEAHRIADPASPLLSVDDLRLVEIAHGVRVELRYREDVDGASVRELRARVREDVAALGDGVCPLSFQMT